MLLFFLRWVSKLNFSLKSRYQHTFCILSLLLQWRYIRLGYIFCLLITLWITRVPKSPNLVCLFGIRSNNVHDELSEILIQRSLIFSLLILTLSSWNNLTWQYIFGWVFSVHFCFIKLNNPDVWFYNKRHLPSFYDYVHIDTCAVEALSRPIIWKNVLTWMITWIWALDQDYY